MTQQTTIQLRVAPEDKERILLHMQNAGYRSLSQFVRSLLLEYDLSSQKMLREVYQKVVLGEEKMKKNYAGGQVEEN